MPTRMIREGLLDSERYWSVPGDAQLLFHRLLLLADDFGCLSLTPIFIRRRCFNDSPGDEAIATLLEKLTSVDLLRPYQVAEAKYGFIPRYRQRLQRMTLKHPVPPQEILEGDDDAKQKFAKVLADSQKANGSPTGSHGLPAVAQQPKGSEVEVEVKGKEKEVEVKKVNGARQEREGVWKTAKELGLKQHHDEPDGAFQARVGAAWERARFYRDRGGFRGRTT